MPLNKETKPIPIEIISNFNSMYRNNYKFSLMVYTFFSGIEILFTGKREAFKHKTENFELFLLRLKIWDHFNENWSKHPVYLK